MTKYTYVDTDAWISFISVAGDGVVKGVSNLYEATPDISLSSEASKVKQISLEDIREGAGKAIVNMLPDYSDNAVVVSLEEGTHFISTTEGTPLARRRLAMWLALNCIDVEGVGLILISELHPESSLMKVLSEFAFDRTLKPVASDVIYKSANISPCTCCGELREVSLVATYDNQGNRDTKGSYCKSCREQGGYVHEDGAYLNDIDLSSKLHPGKSWKTSRMFGGVLDYTFKTTESGSGMDCFKKGKGDSDRAPYLGVELEVSCKQGVMSAQHDLVKEAYNRVMEGSVAICNDGSLSSDNRSFEIISIPAKLNYLKEAIAPLYQDDLYAKGMDKPNHTYGMHVHVGRKELTPLQISKMVIFINATENQPFLTTLAGRSSCSYSSYSPNKRQIKHYKKGYSSERSSALNLNPRDTIEFRLFGTPIDLNDFNIKIEFVDALCSYTRTSSGISNLSYSDFIGWVKANPQGRPALQKYVKTLKYDEVKIPLSTIARVRDSYASLIDKALHAFEARTSSFDSTVFMKKVNTLLKLTSKRDASGAVTKDILSRLYSRMNEDNERFMNVIPRISKYLDPSTKYLCLNNPDLFCKGMHSLSKRDLSRSLSTLQKNAGSTSGGWQEYGATAQVMNTAPTFVDEPF